MPLFGFRRRRAADLSGITGNTQAKVWGNESSNIFPAFFPPGLRLQHAACRGGSVQPAKADGSRRPAGAAPIPGTDDGGYCQGAQEGKPGG